MAIVQSRTRSLMTAPSSGTTSGSPPRCGTPLKTTLCLLAAAAGAAQQQEKFEVSAEARQGEVIRIAGRASGRFSAVWNKRTVPLFPQQDGSLLGLMPVDATARPGVYSLRIEDEARRAVQTAKFTVRDARFRIQNIRATAAMKSLTPSPGEMETMREFNRTVTARRMWRDRFVPPVPQCVNSPFGVRRFHNGKPTGNYHRAVDLLAPSGQPIAAANDGVVKVARMFGYHGGTVGIDHGQGVITHYLHMSKVVATEGAEVKQGDVIGYVGATGFATGAHLHWGLYIHGVPTNPGPWTTELRPCSAAPAPDPARRR